MYRPGCGLFAGLGHLKTSEVADVREHAVRRIERHLDRCGLLGTRDDDLDAEGREALLRYVLRSPIAQERVELRPDGLVPRGQAARYESS